MTKPVKENARSSIIAPASHRRQILASFGGRSVWSIATVLLIIGAWFAIAETSWVSALLLPSPVRVLTSVHDVGWTLVLHGGASLARVLLGFSLGAIVGIGLGVLMQMHRAVYVALDGIVETLRPVPPVAVVPFFVLLFGFSETGKILITAIGVSLIVLVAMMQALERVPAAVVRWGLVLALPRWQLFLRVLLPAAWPDMQAGVRIAVAMSLTLVIVSEFLGARYGLGYLISVSKVTLTTPTLFLAIIITGWLGYFLDWVTRVVFARTCAWDPRIRGATR